MCVCCIVYQIVKHLYMRCVSTGSRIFLFHVAYSVGATVEDKDITCKCHKVCRANLKGLDFCVPLTSNFSVIIVA